MFNLATLFVDIQANQAPFDKALGGVRSQLSTTNVALGTFVGNIAAMGARAAAAVGGDLFQRTIMSASNLGETMDKLKVVMGGSAGIITAEADKLSERFGVSKDEYINAAASFGAVFKGVGKSQEEAAGLGNQLAKLGLDMASLDNASNPEVFTALQAALRGEFDPLERFRVFLSANAVSAEAMRMGLAKSASTMDESAKKAATLSLIMKGTSDAQGNLELTQDSSANSMKKFWGVVENLGTSIGQILMPAFSDLMGMATSALTSIASGFEANKGTFQGWVAYIVEGIATAGFIWRNLSDVWEIVQISAKGMVFNTIAILGSWMDYAGKLGEWFANNWYKLIADGLKATVAAFKNFGENINNIGQALKEWFENPTKGFKFEWKPLLTGFKSTVSELPTALKPALMDTQGQIDAVTDRMAKREADRLAAAAAAKKPPEEKVDKLEDFQGKGETISDEEALADALAYGSGGKIGAKTGKEKKEKKEKEYAIEDTASFAMKLQTSQLGGNVQDKQLDELQLIRETEQKNGENFEKMLAKMGNAVFA